MMTQRWRKWRQGLSETARLRQCAVCETWISMGWKLIGTPRWECRYCHKGKRW